MEASLQSIVAFRLDHLCPSDPPSPPRMGFHLQNERTVGSFQSLWGCTQGRALGKGWPEVFPVHKLCLLSKALLEVAPGLAGMWRAPMGMRWGCDRIEPGCPALARLLVLLTRLPRRGDFGVRQTMRMFSCLWDAAWCRMKGQMPREPAPLLLCGHSHLHCSP